MRALVFLLVVACGQGSKSGSKEEPPKPVASERPTVAQVAPPLDIKTLPPDAVKTPSGLAYKKLVEQPGGIAPKRNDTVVASYTGWKQATGATFFTTKQPLVLSLATTNAGFSEALQVVKKGEKAIVWIPPSLGDPGNTDTLVYELELVDVRPAPEVPPDLKQPPATAQTTKHGAKYVVVKPGSAERARSFDTVTFHYTAWDADGRMFESTEMRDRPATSMPYRQAPVIEDILLRAGKGERIRMWTDSTQISRAAPAGLPAGPLVYEIEIEEIAKAAGEPAPVPADVAAPPAGAKQTKLGVAYRMLKTGAGGPKPGPNDTVTINYTGWTTDGRLIASSLLDGKPARVRLDGVIAGWTDAIMLMSSGDRMRMWVPDSLAYKGAAGQPQGTLVYDLELVSFTAKEVEEPSTAAPPDLLAPPADAKQTPSGVTYKILRAKPGKKPAPKSTVRVLFAGWTTDGKMFDSSKGRPYETKLTNVIDGWAETIPLMSVGEKARLWVPERLAYGGAEGAPRGTLVFDIELLEIVE